MADKKAEDTPVQILREVAESGSPAIVFSTGFSRPCAAHFLRVSDGVVTLDVLSELSVETLQLLSLCFVGFHHARRTRVFVGQVLESEVSGGKQILGLAVPQQIASQEARMSLRVPVENVKGFAVALRPGDGKQLHPAPLNISMSGMLVRFGPSDPDLEVGDRIGVEVAYSGQTVTLDDVVVRRRQDREYGLFFTTTLVAGKISPPEPLVRIVETLQRAYISASSG